MDKNIIWNGKTYDEFWDFWKDYWATDFLEDTGDELYNIALKECQEWKNIDNDIREIIYEAAPEINYDELFSMCDDLIETILGPNYLTDLDWKLKRKGKK